MTECDSSPRGVIVVSSLAYASAPPPPARPTPPSRRQSKHRAPLDNNACIPDNASTIQKVLAMADETENAKGKAAGGYARAEALTKKQRREIAKKAALARWSDRAPTATHEGELRIGDLVLPVAVLNDGRRVLTAGAMLTALGRPWKGSYKRTELPSFLDAANLKPFITVELLRVLQ